MKDTASPYESARAPDCLKCKFFKITWRPEFPHGCTVFGFLCRGMPSVEVFKNTGQHCPAFELKPGVK
ncbi:MAG: hypothetical protein LBQ88_02840 [Treponema sp.]|nr:hypothetical protein [Treponema sp.]